MRELTTAKMLDYTQIHTPPVWDQRGTIWKPVSCRCRQVWLTPRVLARDLDKWILHPIRRGRYKRSGNSSELKTKRSRSIKRSYLRTSYIFGEQDFAWHVPGVPAWCVTLHSCNQSELSFPAMWKALGNHLKYALIARFLSCKAPWFSFIRVCI